MEALLLVLMAIIELLAAALLPAVVAASELLGAIFTLLADLIAQFVIGRLERRSRAGKTSPPQVAATTTDVPARPAIPVPQLESRRREITAWRRWSRRIAIACGVLTAVTIAALLIFNFFFFDSLVRFATRPAARRTGMTLEFTRAEGNLFTGDVRLTGLQVERQNHPDSNFQIEADELQAAFRWSDMLKKERRLAMLSFRGVKGNFERIAAADPVARKPFVIEQLTIADAEVELTDRTAKGGVAKTTLALDVLQCNDYDSRWAAFKVMFESDAHGRLDGHPFEISNGSDQDGRWSRWKADRVPVPLVVTYLGGPFRVLTDGHARIDVTNKWKTEANAKVDLHWQVVLNELKAEVPGEAHPLLAKFAQPVVRYLNEHSRSLPLNFHVVIDQRAFRGKASLETVGLWEVVRESAARTFEEAIGAKFDAAAAKAREAGAEAVEKGKEEIDKARAAGKKTVDRVKGLFKRDEGDDNKKTDQSPAK